LFASGPVFAAGLLSADNRLGGQNVFTNPWFKTIFHYHLGKMDRQAETEYLVQPIWFGISYLHLWGLGKQTDW